MLSLGSPQRRRQLWSGRSLCLHVFLASMARWRRRRQFFSSVGSESGVPSRRQICIQLRLSIGRYHLWSSSLRSWVARL